MVVVACRPVFTKAKGPDIAPGPFSMLGVEWKRKLGPLRSSQPGHQPREGGTAAGLGLPCGPGWWCTSALSLLSLGSFLPWGRRGQYIEFNAMPRAVRKALRPFEGAL